MPMPPNIQYAMRGPPNIQYAMRGGIKYVYVNGERHLWAEWVRLKPSRMIVDPSRAEVPPRVPSTDTVPASPFAPVVPVAAPARREEDLPRASASAGSPLSRPAPTDAIPTTQAAAALPRARAVAGPAALRQGPQWQYEDDVGSWHNIDDDASRIMQRAYDQREETCQYSTGG